MSRKTLVMLGMIFGSTIGGYIPTLWGADIFGVSSILGSAIGGVLGIFITYKLSS